MHLFENKTTEEKLITSEGLFYNHLIYKVDKKTALNVNKKQISSQH